MTNKWQLYEQKILKGELPETLKKYNPILLQLLFNRGIESEEKIDQFLNPSLKYLPKITQLHHIKKTVEIINKAIKQKKKIYIHGDYDVDGMSAVAILWDYLYNVRGANVMPYIPDRVDEGYGLSESSLTYIYDQGAQLVITVDCGIRDYEIIEKWKKKGMEFVVTDHHQLPDQLPDCPIVHPDLSVGKVFSGVSGATIAWLLVCSFEYVDNSTKFSYRNVKGLDLVAISVLSDVMDSRGINRHLQSYGLEELRTSNRKGLVALLTFL